MREVEHQVELRFPVESASQGRCRHADGTCGGHEHVPEPMGLTGSDEGSSRLERRRARRIEEILRATAAVVAERGYYETNLDEIAEILDVSKATLYHYFDSKESLIMACLEGVAKETNSALAVVASGPGTATERLQALVALQLRFATRDFPEGTRLFAQPMLWPESFRLAIRKMREEHDSSFQRVIDDGVSSGEFNIADPMVARHCLYGALNYVSVWTKGGKRAPQAIHTAITDTVMRMFLPCPR